MSTPAHSATTKPAHRSSPTIQPDEPGWIVSADRVHVDNSRRSGLPDHKETRKKRRSICILDMQAPTQGGAYKAYRSESINDG
ncbi:MAG: hypothetical protein QOG20_684 [Pseudonocardiales bacterium]|jgi:hypothetical protein|nr:hypothetical protein [Pseudonocardiales bacterium]